MCTYLQAAPLKSGCAHGHLQESTLQCTTGSPPGHTGKDQASDWIRKGTSVKVESGKDPGRHCIRN